MIERRSIALAITLAVLVAPTPHRAVAAPAQERAAREAFLRTAEIVGREVADVGITLPERVELEQGGVRRRAMFKSLDVTSSQTIRVGQEVQEGLRDSWTFEIAAYELDSLLGLGLVPIAVVRTIGDNEGALIDWVDDALPEYGVSPEGFDMATWEDNVATVWFFDYLVYNIDRTPENLLLLPGFRVKLIDHSRAFQRFLVPMRPLMRFPRQAIDRLRALSDDEIRGPLSDYLTGEEIDALLTRKRRILERVDELLATKPEGAVLF